MKCIKCGKETQMQLQIVISAPTSMYSNLTKKNLVSKEVTIMAALWETADIICNHCGKVVPAYGNYVTNLKKKLEKAEKKIENLTKKLKD